jgi:biopolymer transport protein ExbB
MPMKRKNQIIKRIGIFPLFFILCALGLSFLRPGSLYGQDADPLIQAYQKEFVFLDNEIRLLQQRIAEVNEEGQVRVERARQDLADLEAELLSLSAQVDKRSDELRIIEEERADTLDATDTLESIITQANQRLKKYDVPAYEDANPAEAAGLSGDEKTEQELSYVFGESLQLLDDLGTVRTEGGQFYLQDGTEVTGEITHLGLIASYGVSGKQAGTLAPVGGGKLQLAETETADVARRMSEGDYPETLPIFLYDSPDKAVETFEEKSLRKTIEGGGIIGIVILGLGAIALLLILVRTGLLATVSPGRKDKVGEVAGHIESGAFDKALETARNIRGAMGRVLSATVLGLQHEPAKVEDTVSESVLNEQPRLERFRSAISVFAAVAPLLGLLGTVTGMIATFDVITIHGTGDPKLLSGGISEALITTELGLTVAIPALLIGNLLSSWADRITSGLEVSALRVINAASGFESAQAKGA